MSRALIMVRLTKPSASLFLVVALLVATALACGLPATVTPTVTEVAERGVDVTSEAVIAGESVNVVRVMVHEDTSAKEVAQVSIGTSAKVVVRFDPTSFRVLRRDDGFVYGTSSSLWDPHTVAEMRVCVSLDDPCQLTGEWIPFASDQEFAVDVAWVGPRTCWVVAQFRDATGTVIPSVWGSYQDPEPYAQDSIEIVGILDEATPITAHPPMVQTAVAATRAAFPVRGSVEIEGGRCCVGGTAGDTIDVSVTFEASSPFAEVTEMRVLAGCPTEAEMAGVPWELFVPEQAYPVKVFINWVGFYVGVQYRDAEGNLSPVYCDDISVEGHPAAP